MTYLCLAYEEERKLNELSREEWLDLRQEALDYVESLRSAGQLVDTRPLQSARTAAGHCGTGVAIAAEKAAARRAKAVMLGGQACRAGRLVG